MARSRNGPLSVAATGQTSIGLSSSAQAESAQAHMELWAAGSLRRAQSFVRRVVSRWIDPGPGSHLREEGVNER